MRLPLLLGDLRAGTHMRELRGGRERAAGSVLRRAVESQVLERYSPPHVVVNRDGEIVYYSANTGKYLEPAIGVPSRQLLTMARKGLRLDLRSAFREAIETNSPVWKKGIGVEGDDSRVQMVTLTVEPIWEQTGEESLYLVLFADEGPALSREEATAKVRETADGTKVHLERELRDTRDRLQSMMEEYETALEELKSSNEELVSVNEELQSTNEELEASKEELQSLNEELQTVNAELSGKVDALDQAHGDLQNLFESTQIATVFLDRDLSIRSFTPAVGKIFNILPADRGRPITDLSSKFELPDLEDDIGAVFAQGGVKERHIQHDRQCAHYLLRIIPYRGAKETVDGVVLTFVDVTSLTEAEANQRVLIAELQHRTRNLLAVVRSIASQTLRNSGSLEDFEERFNGRLTALSRVQGLLSVSSAEPVTIERLVRMELDAFDEEPDGRRILIEGPEVALPDAIVRTLALALHELATNAAKHGALVAGTGRLCVSWKTAEADAGRRLELDWVETGVKVDRGKENGRKAGFGRELIERALPFQLKAKTNYELGDEGVRCAISIPLPSPQEGGGGEAA